MDDSMGIGFSWINEISNWGASHGKQLKCIDQCEEKCDRQG